MTLFLRANMDMVPAKLADIPALERCDRAHGSTVLACCKVPCRMRTAAEIRATFGLSSNGQSLAVAADRSGIFSDDQTNGDLMPAFAAGFDTDL